MRIRPTIATALLLCSLSPAALAAITASLDRDEVTAGETLQLVLRHDGRGGGDPDLGPLKKDFDVLGSSSGSSIQFVNGHVSAQRELRVTLAPRHAGRLQVPPLTWDGEQSEALEVAVADGASGSQAGGTDPGHSPHVFLTTSLDDKQPYVQAAVVLTVQLHFDRQLYQAGLDLPASDAIVVQTLGKDQASTETRNGHRYDVVERKYLLLPQRSGTISLDGPTLDAQVADDDSPDPFGANSPFAGAFGGLMNTTRPLRLHGDAIALNVRPRPAAAGGRQWLPATRVTLEATSHPDSGSVHVGEPVTLHLRLSAEGQVATQLPDLGADLSLPEGIKAYPDQPKLETGVPAGVVTGTREQDIAVIASRPGRYQLPAMRVAWWDTRQDLQREAVLPERTLTILPAVGDGAESAATPAPAAVADHREPASTGPADPLSTAVPMALFSSRSPWPWISLGLGLLWLGTLGAWWRLRRRISGKGGPGIAPTDPARDIDVGSARKALEKACRENDPQAARKNLLVWARTAWREHPPAGLNALAERQDDPRLARLLRDLDRACYTGTEWRGQELAAALGNLAKPAATRPITPELAGLYR